MLSACIDIGSNTTRLLVADTAGGRFREVMQQREYTRLRGRTEVSPERIAAIADAVADHVRVARECGCAEVRAVGTAALRDAVNGDELREAIRQRTGVTVQVLSGDDEARLAFVGATGTLPDPPTGPVGVVDVGGGSTELVVGTTGGGVSWATSLPVGSGLLAEAYLRSDPPAAAELHRARQHAAGAFEGVEPPRPPAAYAVGGSAGSLRRLAGPVLDAETLGHALDALQAAPSADVADRLGLDPERVRLLPAGLLVLQEAARAFGAPLEIGCGGVREGVILDELSKRQAA